MTCSIFVTFCFCLLINGAMSKTCSGPNEMSVDCPGDCATDHCPKNEALASKACPKPAECPEARCKCIFNHRRAENGTCIRTEMCPPFDCNGEYEEYVACRPFCSDDCNHATVSGDCPPTFGFILIVLPCTPECRCKKHYWRKNGKCVKYEQCPQESVNYINNAE